MLLRTHNENKHYTREMLAELCDISDRCISNIERGISDPKLSTVIKLSFFCGIDIGVLTALAIDKETIMV